LVGQVVGNAFAQRAATGIKRLFYRVSHRRSKISKKNLPERVDLEDHIRCCKMRIEGKRILAFTLHCEILESLLLCGSEVWKHLQ